MREQTKMPNAAVSENPLKPPAVYACHRTAAVQQNQLAALDADDAAATGRRQGGLDGGARDSAIRSKLGPAAQPIHRPSCDAVPYFAPAVKLVPRCAAVLGAEDGQLAAALALRGGTAERRHGCGRVSDAEGEPRGDRPPRTLSSAARLSPPSR